MLNQKWSSFSSRTSAATQNRWLLIPASNNQKFNLQQSKSQSNLSMTIFSTFQHFRPKSPTPSESPKMWADVFGPNLSPEMLISAMTKKRNKRFLLCVEKARKRRRGKMRQTYEILIAKLRHRLQLWLGPSQNLSRFKMFERS